MLKADNSATTPDSLSFFREGGEMGALMREYNWEEHPLGDPEQWPQSLKTNIRLMLNSRFPMFIWWSQESYAFHNDGYIPALGKKHPQALGWPARKVWTEIWDQIRILVEQILEGGGPIYIENLQLFLERKGFAEETYWTFSYSAAYDDEGEVNGVFCVCIEDTKTVLGQRRLKSLKDISTTLSQQNKPVPETCQLASEVLADNALDIPFNLIYLLNEQGSEATLMGKAGSLAPDLAPPFIDLSKADGDEGWLLSKVYQNSQMEVMDLKDLSKPLPPLSAPQSGALQAAIVPIFRPGQETILGFFLAGISHQLSYDQEYREFHKLLAEQLAISIAGVQAREEVVRQQEDLNALFQQAPVGISVLRGPEYLIDLANLGICELWGRKQHEVIGKPLMEAFPEVQGQGIQELLDGVMRTGVPYVNEELPIHLTRNGKLEKVYFSFVYHPMRDSQGEIAGVIAVAISIDEQVEARKALEKKNKELIVINSDLDNFVYSASHDLKAPVSNIEGLMQTLVDYLPAEALASDLVSQIIGHIQASVERFKRVITDLTEVAKIQREAEEDVRPVYLAAVVAEVILDFDSDIKATGAQVETEILPDTVIQFSAKNARSIVYNLLSNALKYRSPNRKPQIRISMEDGLEFMTLCVKDNGLGMDLADGVKIFSMFKRLHDHVEGSGIGLYIVKKIVENAGGRIEVESKVNHGSTFKVYFRR